MLTVLQRRLHTKNKLIKMDRKLLSLNKKNDTAHDFSHSAPYLDVG